MVCYQCVISVKNAFKDTLRLSVSKMHSGGKLYLSEKTSCKHPQLYAKKIHASTHNEMQAPKTVCVHVQSDQHLAVGVLHGGLSHSTVSSYPSSWTLACLGTQLCVYSAMMVCSPTCGVLLTIACTHVVHRARAASFKVGWVASLVHVADSCVSSFGDVFHVTCTMRMRHYKFQSLGVEYKRVLCACVEFCSLCVHLHKVFGACMMFCAPA